MIQALTLKMVHMLEKLLTKGACIVWIKVILLLKTAFKQQKKFNKMLNCPFNVRYKFSAAACHLNVSSCILMVNSCCRCDSTCS